MKTRVALAVSMTAAFLFGLLSGVVARTGDFEYVNRPAVIRDSLNPEPKGNLDIFSGTAPTNTLEPTKTATATPDYPNMVYVPAGAFQMGCDPAHNGGYSCFSSNELPLHTVYLDGYWIDRTEVTNRAVCAMCDCRCPARHLD